MHFCHRLDCRLGGFPFVWTIIYNVYRIRLLYDVVSMKLALKDLVPGSGKNSESNEYVFKSVITMKFEALIEYRRYQSRIKIVVLA